ncbi:unnamed protein product [Heterobilharzia americana]|nr:unnamed protein product [Heterobilharzia americana]
MNSEGVGKLFEAVNKLENWYRNKVEKFKGKTWQCGYVNILDCICVMRQNDDYDLCERFPLLPT